MSKFVDWYNRIRRPLGFTIGGLNILLSLSWALVGSFGYAIVWLLIGGWIIYDTYKFD